VSGLPILSQTTPTLYHRSAAVRCGPAPVRRVSRSGTRSLVVRMISISSCLATALSLLVAHRVGSRQDSNSVAFGAKRTFREPPDGRAIVAVGAE